ncbi:YkgJ family cysteine cluster protein [Desulfonatronovibrio hydrogenovorans]|uniref:YkgJ family cysteine cluster protein n=1 Tax=Desulfonatronovibrio hydrogenovorans TaxID=53245 RepID=UPI00048E1774|nr:YkgJ family cysteine cluster protein [Desulfonatronovibrio hydrogenovorans]
MDLGIDLNIYFQKYQDLMSGVDKVFLKMKQDFPQEVRCDNGCTECCHALFDLTLVESLYLNHKFSLLDPDLRNQILIEADKADRKTHQIKKKLYKEHQQGANEQEILKKASMAKVCCPLLIENRCVLYQERPITCRLYGIPFDMGGFAASCSLSGFEPGKQYPTVHMDKIHQRLISLSREISQALNSKYPHLDSMLVPVSMSLLTDYSREYLGAREEEAAAAKDSPTKEWVMGPKE